jgi:dihydropteroate synthase
MGQTVWKVDGREIALSDGGAIMGVLNVTPDSFSDGGEFFSTDSAIEHGLQLAADGAAIIDVGGESTRPGASPISAGEELGRVIPVIRALRRRTDVTISIDTTKSSVAEAAIAAGATIINDVSGGRSDDFMLPLAARCGAGFIIMHMQGSPRTMQVAPQYRDVVVEVCEFFRQQYQRAIGFGIDPMAIAFDPGIGFGKTPAHNLELLRNVSRLRVAERPLVVGVSRKSFLAKLTGAVTMNDRVTATVAMTALLRRSGVDVFRVHDVKPNVNALRVAEAFREQGQ